MKKPFLIYCYDAYCNWCYGFGPVVKKIAEEYKSKFEIEVLSGGMMTGEQVMPIEKIAPFIKEIYVKVEEMTGVEFGQDFLWHINHPDKSDWVMNSEKPAIALCIFKEHYPDQQLDFVADMQYALYYEGRDLDDPEAYRHLLLKYNMDVELFFNKLKSAEYKEKSVYEFDLCKQLHATEFPQVLVQLNSSKFYLLAKGFTPYLDLKERIDNLLKELNN